MALLHLIREVLPANRLNCHPYPIQLIYYRQPWFPFKNEFADSVIRKWSLEVYDFPPLVAGVKCHEEGLELVARYPFGTQAMDLPLNTEPPAPRRPYLCGRVWSDVRPMSKGVTWPWRVVFHGHKSSDVDPYDGPIPLGADHIEAAGVSLVFPLRHWSDRDVWDYIEANKIPCDRRRYKDRQELEDKWANPDYMHACTTCIDPRNSAHKVFCPKLQQDIPNAGHLVTRLEQIPQYIEKEN